MPDSSAASPSRPRLLDLFCGAGGAAMGYHRAGFEVTGVDMNEQPRYPFRFFRHDAMWLLRNGTEVSWADRFDAIHASPPCQAYSDSTPDRDSHPDLYEEVRDLLEAIRLPWVIENVRGAPSRSGAVLCGSQFGMRVRRHRVFETSFPLMVPPCDHESQGQVLSVTGNGYGGKHPGHNATKPSGVKEAREVMGIPWMTIRELSEAIPPAYTEYVGRQLLAHGGQEVAA